MILLSFVWIINKAKRSNSVTGYENFRLSLKNKQLRIIYEPKTNQTTWMPKPVVDAVLRKGADTNKRNAHLFWNHPLFVT